MPGPVVGPASLSYLLKASSRSSQSQQHVHWQMSHSQQHRGSSGSGGFNFSHCITPCWRVYRPSVQRQVPAVNTLCVFHEGSCPASAHKYTSYAKTFFFVLVFVVFFLISVHFNKNDKKFNYYIHYFIYIFLIILIFLSSTLNLISL